MDIVEMLQQAPRNVARIIEYRNRYPKCLARLSEADKEFVERVYNRWATGSNWHRECFKHVEGAVR